MDPSHDTRIVCSVVKGLKLCHVLLHTFKHRSYIILQLDTRNLNIKSHAHSPVHTVWSSFVQVKHRFLKRDRFVTVIEASVYSSRSDL